MITFYRDDPQHGLVLEQELGPDFDSTLLPPFARKLAFDGENLVIWSQPNAGMGDFKLYLFRDEGQGWDRQLTFPQKIADYAPVESMSGGSFAINLLNQDEPARAAFIDLVPETLPVAICNGFEAPADKSISVKKPNRVIPLKVTLESEELDILALF